MSFGPAVKIKAFSACARYCCICHRFAGLKIELHHIIQKSAGGKNTFENCIPLCFNCHGDMRSYDHKHPKGTKYTEEELRVHRDIWYSKVAGTSIVSESSENSRVLDSKLAVDLARLLPWHCVRWISVHNFRGAFRSANTNPLENFWDRCSDPAFEFIDTELEGLRAEMEDAGGTLLSTLAYNCFAGNNPEILCIPKEWERTDPKKFKEVIEKVHDAGSRLEKAYRSLIRTARRKFGSEIPN